MKKKKTNNRKIDPHLHGIKIESWFPFRLHSRGIRERMYYS